MAETTELTPTAYVFEFHRADKVRRPINMPRSCSLLTLWVERKFLRMARAAGRSIAITRPKFELDREPGFRRSTLFVYGDFASFPGEPKLLTLPEWQPPAQLPTEDHE